MREEVSLIMLLTFHISDEKAMATRKQLKDRWSVEPAISALQHLDSLGIVHSGHGHTADEIFALLNDLPFRDEVGNGRDFRGASIAARELHFQYCDFSFGHISGFFHCDLTGSVFNECHAERATFHDTLRNCSFVKSKLRSCYLCDSDVRGCTFDNAQLHGCSFEKANLTGSSFRNADCRGVSFSGACLLNCDFRAAKLNEATFQDAQIDSSTDIRGASLVNIYNSDSYDRHGRLRARGNDMRQCSYDDATIFGVDSAAITQEVRLAAMSVLLSKSDAVARRVQTIINRIPKDEVGWQHAAELQFDEHERQCWDEVLNEAYRSLL